LPINIKATTKIDKNLIVFIFLNFFYKYNKKFFNKSKNDKLLWNINKNEELEN